MTRRALGRTFAFLVLATALGTTRPARAEVIEAIVAKIDDDIITKSDFEQTEQETLAELYRRYSGKELDQQVEAAKATLLKLMIDRKILFNRARRMFDLEKAGDSYLRAFREQQNINSEDELNRLLAQENLTIADLKRKLLEMWAPGEVLRVEVGDRTAVSDKEVETYYNEHPAEFEEPAVATVREIVILGKKGDDRNIRKVLAQQVRDEAAAPGADFGALARRYSDAGTKSKDGLLGDFKRGELSALLDEQAFSLPVGQVSPVLEADYGFHIVLVESRTEAKKIPLEEARSRLTERLVREKTDTAVEAFMKKAWSESTVEVAPAYKNRLLSESVSN